MHDAQSFYAAVPSTATKSVEELTAADFANPPQECDIVMKGGITSGIVYPPAILRIAQRFRFRSIGGTSAGAIAAAAAAAAEFRRASGGDGAGFMSLKTDILDWLKQGQNLRSLFVPQWLTAPMFWLFMWLISLSSSARRTTARGALNLSATTIIVAALIIAGILSFFPTLPYVNEVRIVLLLIPPLIAILFGYLLLVLPKNHHGLCTGGSWRAVHLGRIGRNPLTDWLSQKIDAMAGIDDLKRPLTFGDLSRHDISLAMITTCLTMNRPFRVPFEHNIYYFDEDDMRQLFPEYVVQWMIDHPRQGAASDPKLHPLPAMDDLPIIVATRMSLSFPFLFSAVKFYAVDYSLRDSSERKLEPVWFSDGGLSSNFPIDLFDAPLPTRPTMGITLEAYPPGEEDQPDQDVVMAMNNRERIGNIWTRFDRGGQANPAFGFYGAIFNCMQNWRDSIQAEMPGYRDRIAHIRLASNEGGINLTMPPAIIANIVARGEKAGTQLVEHFRIPVATNCITNWNNHREQRMRSILGSFDPFSRAFQEAWLKPIATTVESFAEAIAAAPYTEAARAAALSVTNHVLSSADEVSVDGASLTVKAPKPDAELANRPKL